MFKGNKCCKFDFILSKTEWKYYLVQYSLADVYQLTEMQSLAFIAGHKHDKMTYDVEFCWSVHDRNNAYNYRCIYLVLQNYAA